MKQVVIYSEHPSPSQERVLRRALGPNFVWKSVLPLVSELICSEHELKAKLDILKGLGDLSAQMTTLTLVQPSDEEVPAIPEEEVILALKRSPEWSAFLQQFGTTADTVEFSAKEHSRCWVVAASVLGGGMPPGMGFLVDKFSMSIVPRRFVDVFSPNGEIL